MPQYALHEQPPDPQAPQHCVLVTSELEDAIDEFIQYVEGWDGITSLNMNLSPCTNRYASAYNDHMNNKTDTFAWDPEEPALAREEMLAEREAQEE